MLNVYLDLTERYPRDKFFLNNNSLLNEIVADINTAVRDIFQIDNIFLICNGATQIKNTSITFNDIFPIHDCQIYEIHRHIYSSLSTLNKQQKITAGNILYINPFQGAISAKRLLSMNIKPDIQKMLISAHKTPVNVHPLWVTPVDKTICKKTSFILNATRATESLKNDPLLLKKIQNEDNNHISGSQELKDTYMIDGSLVMMRYESLNRNFSNEIEIIPIIFNNKFNDNLPWYYSIPIFSMAKDSLIDGAILHA